MRIGKVPDQAVRLVIIFATAIVVLVVARQRFIPESFGELGHYRADAIDAVASQEMRYAGWQTCWDCHEEEVEKKLSSYHRTLSCEICHGPMYDHADKDPFEYKGVKPKDRSACLYCHSYLPSRPTGFPQIIESRHNPAESCFSKCHDPHDPTPSEVPGDCVACHRQIARTKAVSHHRVLDCETCHETSPQHNANPRLHIPTKPTTRAFCGQCHAADAEIDEFALGLDLSSQEIPRIDLPEHGSPYACWQCHFPHFPEAHEAN